MNRITYNKETSYSHDDLLWMSYHNSQDVSVCLFFLHTILCTVFVHVVRGAREISFMLYNLRVQRSNGILLLANYNQNTHNFFLIILVNDKGSTIPKTPKEYSLSQLDVHKCNSKRIIRSTSYWSKHINHFIHNDIKINKSDIVVVIIKLHASRIFFFTCLIVFCAHIYLHLKTP